MTVFSVTTGIYDTWRTANAVRHCETGVRPACGIIMIAKDQAAGRGANFLLKS